MTLLRRPVPCLSLEPLEDRLLLSYQLDIRRFGDDSRSLRQNVSVNEAFTAAFEERYLEVSGVYTATPGGQVTTIARDSIFVDPPRGTAINSHGVVAYAHRFEGFGIYAGDGQTTTVIADRSAGFTGFGAEGEPALNDAGTVAFWASYHGGQGLFTGDGSKLTAVVVADDFFASFENRPPSTRRGCWRSSPG